MKNFLFATVLSALLGVGLLGTLPERVGASSAAEILKTDDSSQNLGLPKNWGICTELIEADWLRQADSWRRLGLPGLTTASDGAGAVDGIKNGCYAFHTGQEPFPWLTIDLGDATPIAKLLVFNRLDYAPGLHNADTMQIFASDDGIRWTMIHDCGGEHFGGISDVPPLEVNFVQGSVTTRFLKFQIPSEEAIFFHLDEIEVYGFDEPGINLALNKPADQSSLSPWSTDKFKDCGIAADSFPLAETRRRIEILAAHLLEFETLSTDDTQQVRVLLDAMKETGEIGDADENAQKEYLRLRRLGRRLAFLNPLTKIDHLLFVKRYTQQTYPDICLNHMPWVSRPGGDIFILERPFASEEEKPSAALSLDGPLDALLKGRLGPGHVRGIDLDWNAERVVFGYAKQENFPFSPWPAPVGHERMMGHDLRLSQEPIHLFEIDLATRAIRQITDHEMWSDLDPAYLPDGKIVFVSERCGFSLQCNNGPFHDETSCNLFTVRPEGSNLRWLSYNKDGDYQPHVFLDGTIGYCRWEYQERGWATLQSVWFIRPDGTGADALFKQHLDNPWAFENTREIEKTDDGVRKFVSIAAGHHTLAAGPICILTPSVGMNDSAAIEIVTPGVFPPEGGMSGEAVPEGGVREDGGYYMYPWPLSDKFFLASYTYSNDYRAGATETFRGADECGYGIYLIDVFGNKELIYKDETISSSFPIPLRPRTQPPILPENRHALAINNAGESVWVERVGGENSGGAFFAPDAPTTPLHSTTLAQCDVSNIENGVEGIKPGEVKFLRVARRLGWPYTQEAGGMRYEVDGSSWGISWAPALILGDVPVEPDGSVSFLVPSDASVYFQLLDEDKREIKRMRSFISFQPGECRGCLGCHETRETAPDNTPALMRVSGEHPKGYSRVKPPVFPEPPPWGNHRPLNYLADVQPVLDRLCVSCHAGLHPAAGVDFSGGLVAAAPMQTDFHPLLFDGLNRSYRTMIEKKLVTYSNKHDPASALTTTRPFGSAKSRLMEAITDGSCPGAAAIRPGTDDWYRLTAWIDANVPYHDRFVNSRAAVPYDLPADTALADAIESVHARRCGACHDASEISRLDWINLKEPRNSRFLTAPLATPHQATHQQVTTPQTTAAGGGDGEGGGCVGDGEGAARAGTVRCSAPVYADTADVDYVELERRVSEAVEKAWANPRRDLETLNELRKK